MDNNSGPSGSVQLHLQKQRYENVLGSSLVTVNFHSLVAGPVGLLELKKHVC